jgi:hypothetical protein
MAHLFQVFIRRELSPQEGQRMLAQMNAEVDKLSAAGQAGAGVLKIPGVTRQDNPFPEWLQTLLLRNVGLEYDTINFCYYKAFPNEQQAVQVMDWFEMHFRHWAMDAFADQNAKKVFEKVQVRVMDDHADLQGQHSY